MTGSSIDEPTTALRRISPSVSGPSPTSCLILESPDADFGHWDTAPTSGGVEHLPWFTFGPTADAFRVAVGRGGWVIARLRLAELDGDTGGTGASGSPRRDRGGEAPDELAKLLTAIIRSDRFVEGSIAGAFESGLLARIARRAAVLLDVPR